MWLLDVHTYQLKDFEGSRVPPYAILSHRWEEDEVLFADVIERRHEARKGWMKIKSCCEQARNNNLHYIWADTCCIDKRSSAELSEAINSMYRWYREATVCYAHLCDISGTMTLTESVWFTRGWTLQELLAPYQLIFFDKNWACIGSKSERLQELSEKTGIPTENLQLYTRGSTSIAQTMSWAAGRQTTRVEDRAYSLMGLFAVNMPLLNGEGHTAFSRLQDEIMKHWADSSIFAWRGTSYHFFDMLAASPDGFAECRDFLTLNQRYDVTKHELSVFAPLFPLPQYPDLYAMPVAKRFDTSNRRFLICTPLIKDSQMTHDPSPQERYRCAKLKGERLVSIQEDAPNVMLETIVTYKTIKIPKSSQVFLS